MSSSSGPVEAEALGRFLAEISRAVAVIVRSGRRNRPAISQPSVSDDGQDHDRQADDHENGRGPEVEVPAVGPTGGGTGEPAARGAPGKLTAAAQNARPGEQDGAQGAEDPA